MKITVPLLGAAALGMMLAWVANARYTNQTQPVRQPVETQNMPSQNAAELKKASPVAPSAVAPGAAKTGIQWRPSLEAAFAESERTGKPVMADFYADWCGPCKILDKAYEHPAMVKEAQKWIPVKIDIDRNHFAMQTYNAGSLPTIVFFDARGTEMGRKVGFAIPRAARTESQAYAYLAQDVIKSMRGSVGKAKQKT